MKLRVLPLLLICTFASGCFVFDELDAGNKILDQNFSGGKKAEAPAPDPKAPAPQGGAGWWANAKSLRDKPADPGSDPAVACTLSGATRFMRKSDCLSQGGHPKG
jgi:hypothetical protein